MDLKKLLHTLIDALVDMPEKIEINSVEGSNTSVYEIKVDKSDFGKILGKQGANIKAVRKIMECASVKNNQRIVLELIEK